MENHDHQPQLQIKTVGFFGTNFKMSLSKFNKRLIRLFMIKILFI
jgi:hypothetical protein